jgi:CYTH domain-containing protein/CHAD domain-containing protein
MAFKFERGEPLTDGLRRVAGDALDDAIARLDAASGADGSSPTVEEIEQHVHEVRKRCKEVRGLLRLVRPVLGRRARDANRTIAGAARQLAELRDAHALLGTLDDLVEAHRDDAAMALRSGALDAVRSGQAAAAAAATELIRAGDGRLAAARSELAGVRDRVDRWTVRDRFGSIGPGLRATYGAGRRSMRAARDGADDESMHEWRKTAKQLWYELRLVERMAPSALGPMVDALDDLGEALGDDHDLGVLVAAMAADPEHFGGAAAVEVATELARQEQDELRRRAFRLGARVYAETPGAFTERLRAYWRADRRLGRELRTGGIDELADQRREARAREGRPPDSGTATVEHERKWLVSSLPGLDGGGCALRQGYLALDGTVSVRVRADGDDAHTLTIKGGRGASRTEVEWSISPAQFDALWSLTGERRVDKVRHRLPLDGGVDAELDVFGGSLDGLVLVEVEFDSEEALRAFTPPAWFGQEVTDDDRYSNAALALAGTPPSAE